MSSKKNILKNGFANLIQKFLRIADQLLLVPFFISAWGAAYYGEWLTLTIIPSVLNFSNFGIGSAAANTFVIRYASGDHQGAANIAKTGSRLITYIIIASFVISTFILLILQYFGVFEKSIIPTKDAIIALVCMIGAKVITFYFQVYEGLFRAVKKADISRHLQNGFAFALIIMGIAILLMGGGVVAFAIGNLLLTIIFIPFYILMSYRLLNIPELKTAKIVREDAKETFKIGLGYMLAPAWQGILFQGSTFVVRIILGPASVAIFNTVRTLSRSCNQFFNIVFNSVLPELQYELAKGNQEKAKQLFIGCMALISILALFGMLILGLFGMQFYSMWTKNTLNPPMAMWLFFVLGIGFNALWWTTEIIFIAKNKPFRIHSSGVVFAILSVLVTFITSKKWGLSGTGIGVCFFEIAMALYIIPFSFKMLGITLNDFNLKNILLIVKKATSRS